MTLGLGVRPLTCQPSSSGRPHIYTNITECDAKVSIQPTSFSHNTLYFLNLTSSIHEISFHCTKKKVQMAKKKKPHTKFMLQIVLNENV